MRRRLRHGMNVAAMALRYVTSCPVGCVAEPVDTSIVLAEGRLLSCPECGVLMSQCDPARYEATMAEFDAAAGTLPDAASAARRSRRERGFLATIAQLAGRPPGQCRLLDVGCSSGSLLRTAREMGFVAAGVEPAPQAAAAARALGFDVRTGTLAEARFADASFEAITLTEVIEHLADAHSVVAECRRLLAPGGVLMIGTGNTASWTMAFNGSSWEYLDLSRQGGHVCFYSPRTIHVLAARCGLAVAAIYTRRVRLLEGARSPLGRRVAKLAAGALGPLAKLLGRGHDMQAYLRR